MAGHFTAEPQHRYVCSSYSRGFTQDLPSHLPLWWASSSLVALFFFALIIMQFQDRCDSTCRQCTERQTYPAIGTSLCLGAVCCLLLYCVGVIASKLLHFRCSRDATRNAKGPESGWRWEDSKRMPTWVKSHVSRPLPVFQRCVVSNGVFDTCMPSIKKQR